MTDLQLKDRLAYILFAAKFGVIVWTFFMWMTKGYNFQQLTEILAILIPLFSVHMTIIIKDYLENKEHKKQVGIHIRKPLVFFSQTLPIGYTIYMLLVIAMVPGQDKAFAQMKTLLGVGETIFGVYLGMIISTLFKAVNVEGKKPKYKKQEERDT